MGPHKLARRAPAREAPRDADLARAEAFGLRDLRMVMEDVLARGVPAGADDFPWPTFMHDGQRVLQANPACLRWFECKGDGSLTGQPLSVLCRAEDERQLSRALTVERKFEPDQIVFADSARLAHVLRRRARLPRH